MCFLNTTKFTYLINNIVFSYLYFILKCEYFNDILLIKDRLEFCETIGYA